MIRPADVEPSDACAAPESRWLVWVITLLLALTTLGTFWRVGRYDFVNYDDPNYIRLTPEVRQGLTTETFVWAFSSSHHCNWHPLTTLSYLTESRLFGIQDAGPFHLTNLFLHVASTVTLFLMLRAISSGATWRSAFVAALFALHPLHVESVAWVSERKDVLSALFAFLTIGAYGAYVRRGGWSWYVATFVLLGLGLMSKPMLVTMPFVLLLLDYWPLKRSQNWGRLVLEKLPLMALSLASSVITFIVQRDCGAMATIERSPMAPRLANATVAYVQYVAKMFWPTKLMVFYPYTNDLTKSPLNLWPFALVILLIATGAAIWLGRRHRYLTVGWFWFLGMLVPVIGIVQVGIQSMAERYTYLPLIGLFIVVSWGAADLVGRRPGRRQIVVACGIAAILTCTVATARQLGYWQNSYVLFTRGLEVSPDNPVFNFHAAEAFRQQQMPDEAIAQYRRVLDVEPNNADALGNLGLSLAMKGQNAEGLAAVQRSLELIEGETHHSKAPALRKRHASAYHNVGILKLQAGDYAGAEVALARVLEIDPSDPESHTSLGVVQLRTGQLERAETSLGEALRRDASYAPAYGQMGHLRLAQKRPLQAVEQFQTALRLAPANRDADFHLGVALAKAGRADEAVAHLSRFSERYPDDSKAYFQLGVIAQTRGDAAGAILEYEQAISRDPRSAALNNLAWIRATSPSSEQRDGVVAVQLAEQLRDVRGEAAEVLDTLAAAYAETGDFPRAIAAAEQAISLADRKGDVRIADDVRRRLGLYREGKPYHETEPSNPAKQAK